MNNLFLVLSLGLSVILSSQTFAQQPLPKTDTLNNTGNKVFSISLEELMNIKVTVASNKLQKQEEAPSIVSVITAKEIQSYGYRDLSDILRTIPGFDFGIDVAGNVGLSFRGIWAHEGKCLLTINGIMVNDQAFGNYNYFNAILADMIEKVEIIRGPGSALYGGFAEVTLINVITRNNKKENTAHVATSGGIMGDKGFTRSVNANFEVHDEKNESYISGSAGMSSSFITTKNYTDNAGNTLTFDPTISTRTWKHFVVDSKLKNLFVNLNYNELDYGSQDGFTTIIPKVNGKSLELSRYTSNAIRAKYEAKISDKFKVVPTVEYNATSPIAIGLVPNQAVSSSINSSVQTSRVLGEVMGEMALEKIRLVLGVGYIRNMATGYGNSGNGTFFSKDKKDTTNQQYTESKYLYVQSEYRLGNFTGTAGFRGENTTFGNAFAPRIGITFAKGKFNTKALYGNSYRIPTPINAYYLGFASATANLNPEKAQTYELEFGYKLVSNLVLKTNLFYIKIKNPIVYLSNTNSYQNFGNINTEGIESELRYTLRSFIGYANMSYFAPTNSSTGFLTLDDKHFLGLSPLKITAGVSKEFSKFQIAPSVVYLSRKTAQGTSIATPDNITIDAAFLVNLTIKVKIVSNVDISFTGYNITGANYYLSQPYYGGHAPMPALDRNILAKLIWTL
jgi:outer membrane cobalamin receptor